MKANSKTPFYSIALMVLLVLFYFCLDPQQGCAQDKKPTPFPFQTKQSKPRSKKYIPSVSRIKIWTEVPATVFYDKDTAGMMTSLNQAVVERTRPGEHTIVFRTGSGEYRKTFKADSGATHYIMFHGNDSFSDTVVPGRLASFHPQKISNFYIPFRHAFSLQIKPGFAFKSDGSGFDAQVITGYYFHQKISVGIGAGYTRYATHMSWAYMNFFDWSDITKIETTYFMIDCIPLFVNGTFYLSKKQFAPYFSFSAGLNFPLTQTAEGKLTGQEAGYYFQGQYFRIEKIAMGGYIGLEFGCKYYLSPLVDLGASAGVELCFNKLTGSFYKDSQYQIYQEPLTYQNDRAAITLRIVCGLNFGKETLRQK